MQRSDPPRPAGADAAAANSDPQKPAAENPSPEPDVEAFAEAEPEATERTHFEALERETTQPLRRYFEPRSVVDITPADLGHAVDYEVPVESAALPSSDAEPPQADAAPLEPWPDPLPATSESDSEQHAAEFPVEELPAAAGEEERAPEGAADPDAFEAWPVSEVEAAPPAYEEPEPQQPPARTFEPSPFTVPAPRTAPPPSFEPSPIEPAHFEPWPEQPEPEPPEPASYARTAEPVAPSRAATGRARRTVYPNPNGASRVATSPSRSASPRLLPNHRRRRCNTMSPRPGPRRQPCGASRRSRAPSRLGSPSDNRAASGAHGPRLPRPVPPRRARRRARILRMAHRRHAAHRRLPLHQPAVLDADGAAVPHRHGDP